jgi:hypothetical protein
VVADRMTKAGVGQPDHLARFPQNVVRLMEDPGQLFRQRARLPL